MEYIKEKLIKEFDKTMESFHKTVSQDKYDLHKANNIIAYQNGIRFALDLVEETMEYELVEETLDNYLDKLGIQPSYMTSTIDQEDKTVEIEYGFNEDRDEKRTMSFTYDIDKYETLTLTRIK